MRHGLGGELDWKIIAVRLDGDSRRDIDEHMPGELDRIRNGFRDYKVLEGKGRNSLVLGGRMVDGARLQGIIRHAHEAYSKHSNHSNHSETKVKTTQTFTDYTGPGSHPGSMIHYPLRDAMQASSVSFAPRHTCSQSVSSNSTECSAVSDRYASTSVEVRFPKANM